MCKKCKAKAQGVRRRRGVVSTYLLGIRACKHAKTCSCSYCSQFRDKNKYADTGVFFQNRPEVDDGSVYTQELCFNDL